MNISNVPGSNFSIYNHPQSAINASSSSNVKVAEITKSPKVEKSTDEDSRLKYLQRQIEMLQLQLQDLSNDKTPMGEKLSRQKNLQLQIQNLSIQLSQRKTEVQQGNL